MQTPFNEFLSSSFKTFYGLSKSRGVQHAGIFKALLVGQSEDFYTISTFHDELAKETLIKENIVTFWWHDRTNAGAAGVQSVTLNNNTIANDSRVTAGMVAMANTFLRNVNSNKIDLIMMVMSGTEPREVMDDSFAPGGVKRRWQDDWALHTAATADGVSVQWGWHSWFAAPGTYADDYAKAFAAYLWGRDTDGNLLTYSEETPLTLNISGNDWQISRTLRDLFGGDGPKWVAMGGSHRFTVTSEPDMTNAITLEGGGQQFAFQNKEASTNSWRSLIKSDAFKDRVVTVNMHLNAHSVGKYDGSGGWTDSAHPSGWTDEGINYRARQTAHAILRGAGITNYGLPVIDNAEWQEDGSYMEFWSSAGPITTLREMDALVGLSPGEMDMAALHDEILAGKVAGSRITAYRSASDWEAETGLTSTNITGNVGVVYGVDFREKSDIFVKNGATVIYVDCIFGGTTASYAYIDAYSESTVFLVHCTIEGPADGTGPGVGIRRRTTGSLADGRLISYACEYKGYASDALKISAGDKMLFNYFDTPTTMDRDPVVYTPGTYAVGDLVVESDAISGKVWRNTVVGNVEAPDFTDPPNTTTNGWIALDPHSDNITLTHALGCTVFGNVFNLDPARRRMTAAQTSSTGFNGNIWSKDTEDYTGSLIAANLCLRDPRESGGNPLGSMNGANVLYNRIESRAHGGSYYFAAPDANYTTNYQGNIDPANNDAPIPAPANGTLTTSFNPIDSYTMADKSLEEGKLLGLKDYALPKLHPHWTQVSGVQVDGAPAQRVNIVNGRVRVYPISGSFTNLSKVTFGEGGASGMLLYPEDHQNALYRDFPIVDLGLSDVPGLPLAHLPDATVMASTVPGAATFTTSSTGPFFVDPTPIGNGVSEVTVLINGAVDFAATGSTGDFGGIEALGIRLELLTGAASIRCSIRDSASTMLLSSQLTASGIVQNGVEHSIIASVSLTTRTLRVWVDGELKGDFALPENSGVFSSVRKFVLGRYQANAPQSAQIAGTWKRMAIWKEHTADGTLPTSTPHVDITGNAATINVHAWKQGTDAA